ncbi:unnamed protein product [Arabidopsis halleri]
MVKEAAPEYVNSPTGVWWNMNRCPIPDGYDACQVGPRIDMVLKSLGYSGPLTITAVGDLEDIPVDVLRALSSTGILIRDIPHVNQPPATVMLISDDLDLEAMSDHFCENYEEGYNTLLAYPHALPKKYVANPEKPFDIVTPAQWLWDNFLKDAMDPQETRRLECFDNLFKCRSCRCPFASQSFEEFTDHLQCRDHIVKGFKIKEEMKRYKEKKQPNF